ncbi:MAG: 16S rRNA processing protein RimM, partial [Clostridia bacterium]|nr:16S rRNA processing protein RimM [Clostridia bacterium]
MAEKEKYLECGKIINTHGVRGNLKIESWCDSLDVFCA